MSENQKKVYEKPEVTFKESQKEIYPGITVIADENYIPRSELTVDDIKKFGIVKVDILAKFKNGRDNISFKVYPFQTLGTQTEVVGGKEVPLYFGMIRLNDDISNNVRLTRNTYTKLLLKSKMELSNTDKEFSILRYARLVTSEKEGKRYYRLQLFLSFDNVINLWISESDVITLSELVKSKKIKPIVFYQATSEELGLEEKLVEELI